MSQGLRDNQTPLLVYHLMQALGSVKIKANSKNGMRQLEQTLQ
jgi:hypothetical protein